MIFDFDHLGGKLSAVKEQLMNENNVYAVFTSPRGDGLKLICRLNNSIRDYNLFTKLYEYHSSYFTKLTGHALDTTSDACRACFISHDPEIYINEYAVPLATDVEFSASAILANKEKKKSAHESISPEENLFLPPKEGQRTTGRSKLIGYLINKDLTLDNINNILLMQNGYCNPPEDRDAVIQQVEDMFTRYHTSRGAFWDCSLSKKKDKVIIIEERRLFEFLEGEGFGKIYNKINPIYIRVKNNIIDFTSTAQMKDFARSRIEAITELAESVKSRLCYEFIEKTSASFFSDKRMDYQRTYEHKIKRDTKDTSFVYYKNCYVEIQAHQDPAIREYSQLDGIIWRSQVLERNYRAKAEGGGFSDFEQFLKNVVRGDESRFNALKSVIGYLLHNYKNPSLAKAVVLTDEKISDNPNGRSGKSLIGNALKRMRKVSRIDGKNFEFDRFAFQQVDPDTAIMDFNDVAPNFEFEKLFSIVTDELTVEKKNQQSFNMEFEESPKILISTNYTIKGSGASYRARLHEVEFSDFYNDTHTPLQSFGKLLFNDWNEEEWLAFDHFMIECIQFYLKNGLIESPRINIDKRKIIDATKKEFVSFMEEQSLGNGEEREKGEFYNSFLKQYSDYTELRKNTFTKWLDLWGTYIGMHYQSRRSNGKEYISFCNSAKVTPESAKSEPKVQNQNHVCTAYI